jgi:hypothetical protein
MPTVLNELSAWRDLEPPVRVGPAAPGTITVQDAATERGYELVTKSFSELDTTRRAIQLTPLHLSNHAIIELLVRPVFADGIWIAADGNQLGLVLDAQGDLPEWWLASDAPAGSSPGASEIGAAIGALLGPVVRRVTRCSRIHRNAVATIAAESAIGGLFRTARSAGRPDDADWLDEASAAIAGALGAHVSAERLQVYPDDGPVVVRPTRSLCCVLHTKTTCHACPGCPVPVSTSDWMRDFTEQLAAMTDEEFLDSVGRPRLTSA